MPDQAAAPNADPAEPEPRRTSEPAILVDLVEDAGDWTAFGDSGMLEALVRGAAEAVAHAAPLTERLPPAGVQAEVVVALSSDAEVTALNAQFRGKKKPTNVLSFPAAVPAGRGLGNAGPMPLGDIVLAAETVLVEAADMGISPADHLRHLIVHGLLHLLGYDHIEAAQADEMEALETQILASLGVADPYAGSEPVTAPS